MEESGAIKPVLRPYCMAMSCTCMSRVWEETQSCILVSLSITSVVIESDHVQEVAVTESEVRAA